MRILNELTTNTKKYSELIKRKPTELNNERTSILFSLSVVYGLLAMHIENVYAIPEEKRKTFFKRCLFLNRFCIGALLKKGRESYEKHLKEDALQIPENIDEIELNYINDFLQGAASNVDTINGVSDILKRGLILIYEQITEEHFSAALKEENYFSGETLEITYDELKSQLLKDIHGNDFDLHSDRTKQCLQYFQCASPVEEVDYQCFYKPFFMALQDYSNYLRNRAAENSIEIEASATFTAIDNDFREGYSGRLSYDDIQAEKQFKYMEEMFFDDGVIDADYNFIEKRGNKKALAAAIKFMIDEKYFRKSNYKHSRNFEFHHYRQYLDHRYGTSTVETMKKLTDKDVKLHFLSIQWKYDLRKLVNTDFYSLTTL